MSQPGYERSQEQIVQGRAITNAELALADLVTDLERLRKRLTQDTYYAVDDRLI